MGLGLGLGLGLESEEAPSCSGPCAAGVVALMPPVSRAARVCGISAESSMCEIGLRASPTYVQSTAASLVRGRVGLAVMVEVATRVGWW